MVQSITEMVQPLRGQRALVAGGDGEIGRTICAGLAADGADVAIVSVAGEAARELATRLRDDASRATASGATTTRATTSRATAYEADITRPTDVEAVVDDLVTSWGGVDILVNCAGILRTQPAEAFDVDDWRAVVETNLTGAFVITQAVGRAMIKTAAGGRIVHLSSVRATVGLSIGGFSAYGASKAGLHLLIRQLAGEWGRHQISVNGVAAGFVRTALSAGALGGEDFQRMVAARTPLGRMAAVDEVANAALYLASPRSSFITGHVLLVDGGLTAVQ
jgi:NAD(P)-dependent dehydrogenase (short-subunit alcohol dehydrogenase family)